MVKLAGEATEGLLCSQAGIPVQAASKKFLDAFKKRFNADPIIYAPFTYDAANLLIEAMKKADSADPAKYLPELQKISFTGSTGPISFDEKGDRKDAEITIFAGSRCSVSSTAARCAVVGSSPGLGSSAATSRIPSHASKYVNALCCTTTGVPLSAAPCCSHFAIAVVQRCANCFWRDW